MKISRYWVVASIICPLLVTGAPVNSATPVNETSIYTCAAAGNASALNELFYRSYIVRLGKIFEAGFGDRKRQRNALVTIRDAAGKRDHNAQLMMGVIYLLGLGVEQNTSKAAEWYRKAAEDGNAEAQRALALDYFGSAYVNPDSTTKWWQTLAVSGDTEAEARLGRALSLGEPGGETNPTQGAVWLHKAAQAGNQEAACELSYLYKNGIGVNEDYAESYFWGRVCSPIDGYNQRSIAKLLTTSQKQAVDNRVAHWKPQPSPSVWYSPVVTEDQRVAERRAYEEALQILQPMAEKGNSEAEFGLALMKEYGLAVPQDFKKSWDLLKSSAEHGNPRAKAFSVGLNRDRQIRKERGRSCIARDQQP